MRCPMFRSARLVSIACSAVLVSIAGLFYWLSFAAAAPAEQKAPVEFTADGKLKKPEGYRQWVYVGTPLTPNELNGGAAPFPDFHAVYIDPESYAEYQRSGKFRDGTVMVKELVGIGAKEASSGKGYFMGDFIGLETSVKDSNRFKDEPGHWAYFSFGHKYPLHKEAEKESAVSCNACHAATAGEDDVFTQYYPVLRAAAPRSK